MIQWSMRWHFSAPLVALLGLPCDPHSSVNTTLLLRGWHGVSWIKSAPDVTQRIWCEDALGLFTDATPVLRYMTKALCDQILSWIQRRWLQIFPANSARLVNLCRTKAFATPPDGMLLAIIHSKEGAKGYFSILGYIVIQPTRKEITSCA